MKSRLAPVLAAAALLVAGTALASKALEGSGVVAAEPHEN